MVKITYLERNPEMVLPEEPVEPAAAMRGVTLQREQTVHERTGSVRAIERVRAFSIRQGKPLAEQEMTFEEFRKRQRDRGIAIEPVREK